MSARRLLITTHSAEFLRTSGEEVNVIVVSKRADVYTTCTSVNLKDYARILVHEFSSELFFAEKVIVCEGYDEFLPRAVAKEIFAKQLDSQNISVISAAGKDNLSTLVQLVMKLGVKCHILADFDVRVRTISHLSHLPDSCGTIESFRWSAAPGCGAVFSDNVHFCFA